MWHRSTIALLLATLVACSGNSPDSNADYDEDWGSTRFVEEESKADGLFDTVQELTFSSVGTGFVGGEQLDLYRMDLRQGDSFTVELSVTSGDLNPHVSLFFGSSIYVHSDRYELLGDNLIKWYTAEHTGQYLVAVRPYRGEGEGRYRLTATCEGGPCNGEYVEPIEELDLDEVNRCIQQARRCSFERLPEYNGRVAEVRANDIFHTCLAEASTTEGFTCTTACTEEAGEDAPGLCGDMIRSLIFYADQSEQCLAVLDDCMSGCYYGADDMYYGDAEFWTIPESICWANGFNGTCDGHARSHEACGGPNEAEGYCDCMSYCQSTDGAWMDDLDVICDESCEGQWEELGDWCSSECDGDPECISLCTYEMQDECY